MGLLSKRQNKGPGFNRALAPEVSTWDGIAGSFRAGYKESLTSVGVNLLARSYAGYLDGQNGINPQTKEEFLQRYGEDTQFEFRPDETPSQVELRYEDWIDEQIQRKRSSGVNMAGNLAFGMAGNMASPLDVAAALVPYAGMAKIAKAASVSLRTGQKLSAAAKTVEALSSNKLSTKLIQGALAGEKTPLKAGETFFQLTKLGAVEQTIENTAVYFGSQSLGRDYGTLDAAADTVFGAGILSVLGGFQTRKLMKVGNMMARDITNSKALSILAEGGDIQAVVKHLNNYSEDVTGTFMDSVEKNPRIQAILEMDEATFNADPNARGELQEFLGRNRAGVFFSTLKGNIPFEANLSVIDAKRKQHAQMARITEALPDYLRGEDVSGRLTPDEMKIIHDTDANLQRLMETVGGSEPEFRVDVAPEPRKSFLRTRQEKDTLELERLLEKGDRTLDDDARIQALERRLEGEQRILEERTTATDLQEGDLVVYDGYEGTLRYGGERAVLETTDGTLVDINPDELSQVSRTAKRVAHKEGSDQIFIEGTQFRIGDPEATIQMDADGAPQKATLIGPGGAKTDITDPDVVYRVGSILHAEKVRKRRGSDIRPRREDAFDDTAYEDATLVHDWAGAWDEGTIRTVQTLEEGGHVSAEEALQALDELEAQSDFMMELPISEKRKMEVLEELYETEKVINRYLEKWTAPKTGPTIPLRGEAPKVSRKTRKTRGEKLLEEGVQLKKRALRFRVHSLIKSTRERMGVENISKAEKRALNTKEIHLQQIQESFEFLGNRNHFIAKQKRLEKLLRGEGYRDEARMYMRLEQRIFAAAAEGDVDKIYQLIDGHHDLRTETSQIPGSVEQAEIRELVDKIYNLERRTKKRVKGQKIHPNEVSKAEVAAAKKELSEVYQKAYKKELAQAAQLISDLLGIPIKKVRLMQKQSLEGNVVLGRYEPGTGRIDVADVADMVQTNEVTPFQVMMHEATHLLKDSDPVMYGKLRSSIMGDDKLWSRLTLLADERGYGSAETMFEMPSILMEWAVTQPEFWKALEAKDPGLYKKFAKFIQQMLEKIGEFLLFRSPVITVEDVSNMTPGQLAAKLGAWFAQVRKRNQQGLGQDPTLAQSEGPYLSKVPRKPAEQATSELDTNLEAEAAKGREATEARNKEAAKEVEGRAKKAIQTPLQVAKERVEAQLEGPLAAIILDTKTNPEDLLVKLGEVAETLGPDGSPVRARYTALVSRIIEHKRQTGNQYDHARGVLELGTKPDLSTTGEEGFIRLVQLRNRMETEKLSEQEALREYAQWLDEEQMKQALAEINNDRVLHYNDRGLRRMKTSKGKLKYLKSFTDGLQRKGVRLFGGSIQSDIHAQITKDMSKLRQVFAKHGFLDELDNTVHRVDGEKDIPVTERAEARREASNMFVWDLGQYYKTGEVPDHYGDRKADFEELGEALRDTLHSQITQLNEYGAGIRLREDHLGFNQRWSDEVIRRMGFDAFRTKVDDWVDWTKVEESHGGMMVSSRNEHGYADEMMPFDKEVFIRQWFDEAVSPVKPQDHPSTNIARSFGKARMIHMKPEYEMQSLIEFSGHGSLGRLLQDQIRHRSEMIAIMRNLGNEPLANFDKIVRNAGIDANTNTTRVESGSKLDRALVASGAAHRTHKMDVNHMYKTVEFLTGASDNPANHDLSFWGKSYRQLSNIAFMWTAGVSAITDVPITLLTLEQMGADVSIPQLMGAMKRSATRRFIDKDRGELTAFFEGSGAAFDAMKNAGARRLALAESNGDTFLAKGSEMMFTINGVSGWTSMMQEAFVDVLTQSLARQSRSGDWDPHMRMTMRSMGFTQDDFLRLSDGIVDINGVERVGPPSFEGQDLQMKLLQFFSEYRDKAVIVPDASTQSLIRFGTQAGTWQGEAVRSVMQYASFPVAMNRVVNRMMMLNAEGRNPWTTGQLGVTRMAVFMGGMMGMAYAAMVMKDLARLREPAMPWEMNQAVLGRLIDQSGIPGAFGILMGAVKDGRVSSVIAPNVSTQINVMGKLYNEGFGGALYASKSYTGDNIPVFGPLITTGLAYGFQGEYAKAMRIGANFRERELNVEQWTPVPKP